MLGKLMKYDLKWIYKPLIIFYILGLVFSGIARGLSNIENSIIFNIVTQVCYGISIAMMFNIIINNFMRCWVRLVRNVYKDESYLTHTLPIKNKTIFLSKVLSGFIAIITSFVVIFICIAIGYGTKNNIEIIKGILTPVASILEININTLVIVIAVILILEFTFILIAGYLGIVLGHKSNNKRIIKSVIYGFCAFMVMSITTLLLLFVAGLFNSNIMNLFDTVELPNKDTIQLMMHGGIILYLVYILIYYIIGSKIIKKGVNVE